MCKLTPVHLNFSIKTLILFAVSFCFSGCNSNPSMPPDFKDNGLVVEHLLKNYQCESVEFENWEDSDAQDSTLTICLINSKLVPLKSANSEKHSLEQIASQIKKSLKYPDRYKSYYVIFVKREGFSWFRGSTHTYGGEFPSDGL